MEIEIDGAKMKLRRDRLNHSFFPEQVIVNILNKVNTIVFKYYPREELFERKNVVYKKYGIVLYPVNENIIDKSIFHIVLFQNGKLYIPSENI